MNMKKLISMLLVVALLLSMGMPYQAAEAVKPLLLETAEIDAPEGSSSYAYFGTLSSQVAETGSYVLTVNRGGNTETAGTVELKTVDVSARYGEDYTLTDKNYETTITPVEKTLLESGASQEALARAEEEMEALNSLTSGEIEEDDSTAEDPFQSLYGNILRTLGLNMASDIETSSTTLVEFAEGESEKQIVFEVIDDSIAEGSESFDFMLANPSEGLDLTSAVNCTITIEDDEPKEYSKIGLSHSEYDAKDGKATVTVLRENALYSVATARLASIDTGDAKEGIHFQPVDVAVQFLPYETEKVIEIDTLSDKNVSFQIDLTDIKGAEADKTLSATINILANKSNVETAPRNLLSTALLKTNEDQEGEQSFKIKPYNKEFTVKYMPGDTVGKIIDTSVVPEVTVGDFYFPLPSYLGGTFDYEHIDGYVPNNWYSSYNEDLQAGALMYYSSTTGKKGMSYFFAAPLGETFLNTRKYQYMFTKWAGKKRYSDKNAGFMAIDGNRNKIGSWGIESNMDEFGELGIGNAINSDKIKLVDIVGDNSVPTGKDINIQYYVQDKTSGTPKMQLEVYGLAAMYRKFRVNLLQPDKMTYQTASGTVQKEPAQAELGAGHEVRFSDQDIQVIFKQPGTDPHILGTLEKYVISVKKSAAEYTSFDYYPEDMANTGHISLNEEFIALLDSHCRYINENSEGFETDIRIKPVFKYKKAEVSVLTGEGGKFANAKLSTGDHTFHVGDELDLQGTADSSYSYWGYDLKAYNSKSDTQPEESGKMRYTGNKILYSEKYELKPIFTKEQNRIEVKITNDAVDKIKILNAMEQSKLPQALKGKRIIAVEPEVGKVYQIQAIDIADAGEGKLYRPIFMYKGNTYHGNVFDLIAEADYEDNVVTIGVEEIDPAGYTYFQMDGTVSLGGKAIRDSADNPVNYPASDVVLIAGSRKIKMYDTSKNKELTLFERVSSTTGEEGEFSLKGIYAKPNDQITCVVQSGDVETVAYLRLSNSAQAQNITFVETEYDENTHSTTQKTVTKSGHLLSAGNIELPQRTPYSPYVSHVSYTFEKDSSYTVGDVTQNAVPILDDYINITAHVTPQGRQVKQAVFVLKKKIGDPKEFTAISSGSNQFTVTLKMDDEFASGDTLFVKLVDKEERTQTFAYYDEVAKATVETKQQVPIVYAETPTGLSFYVPTLEAKPQYFAVPDSSKIDIPILGEMSGAMNSGILKTQRVKYGDSQFAPYDEQVNLNVNFKYPLGSPGAMLANIQNGTASQMATIEQQLAQSPDKAIEDTGKEIINLFGTEGDIADQKAMEKETKNAMKNQAFKDTLAKISKPLNIKTNLTVLLNFSYNYDYELNEYVFTGGQYLCAAMGDVSKNFYWVVYGIPLYVNVGGNMSLRFDGKFKTDENVALTKSVVDEVSNLYDVMTPENDMQMGFGAKVMAGVGICGVLGARGVVGVDFLFRFPLDGGSQQASTGMDGFRFKLYGGIGIDMLAFSFDYTPDWAVVNTGVYDTSGKRSGMSAATTVIRPYDMGTAEMSDFGQAGGLQVQSNLEPDLASLNVLLDNAPEKSQPFIMKDRHGTTFAFFMGRRDGAQGLNASCVMWTKQGDDGTWTAPQPVTTEATPEFNLSVERRYLTNTILDQTMFILTFSKAETAVPGGGTVDFDDVDAVKDFLHTFKIAETEMMVNHKSGGEVSFINNDPLLFGQDGKCNLNGQVNWDETAARYGTLYTALDLSAAQSLKELGDLFGKVGVEHFVDYRATELSNKHGQTLSNPIVIAAPTHLGAEAIVIDASIISTIFPYDPKITAHGTINSNQSMVAMCVDLDGSTATADDREIYLQVIEHNKRTINEVPGSRFVHYPFRISKAGETAELPRFEVIDGTVYLFWTSNRNTINKANISEAITAFCDMDLKVAHQYLFLDREDIGSTHPVKESQPKDYEKKTAADLGLTDEQYEGTIYERLYTGDFAVEQKLITADADTQRNITNTRLVGDGEGGFYLLWTEPGSLDNDDYSVELYGMAYKQRNGENGDEEQKSGWGQPVQLTDFGKVIGSFSAVPEDNGGLTVAANMYEQTVKTQGDEKIGGMEYSGHEIVEITFNEVPSVEVEDGMVAFGSYLPQPSTEDAITFNVKNTGIKQADGYEITVKQDINGTVTTVDTVDSDRALLSGESTTVSVPWSVPADLTNAKIIIEVAEKNVAGQPKVCEKKVELISNVAMTNSKMSIEEGELYLNLDLTNTGNKVTENLKAKSSAVESNVTIELGTANIDAIGPGETAEVKIKLNLAEAIENADKNGVFKIDTQILGNGNTVILQDSMTYHIPVPQKIEINEGTSFTIGKGSTQKLTATFMPQNVAVPRVTYTSSNPTVATVDANGMVTGSGGGTAVITVHNIYTGLTTTVDFTVTGTPFDGDETDDSGIAPDEEVITPPGPQPPSSYEEIVVDTDTTETVVKSAEKDSTANIAIPPVDTDRYVVEFNEETVNEITDKNLTIQISTDDLLFIVPQTAFCQENRQGGATITAEVLSTDPSTGFITANCDVTVAGNEVKDYKNHAELWIPLPDGTDTEAVLTGVLIGADGKQKHLPTSITEKDGKLYAVVRTYCGGNIALVQNQSVLTDISGTWYEQDAREAAERLLVGGYTDNTFRGDRSITRAEFTAIVSRALGLYIDEDSDFRDVEKSTWYYGNISDAYARELVLGRTKDLFVPEANIKRCEAMVILHRAAKLIGYPETGEKADLSQFADVQDIPDWAKESVIYCLDNKLLLGSNGRINPDKNITRAETATLLLRFLKNSELVK